MISLLSESSEPPPEPLSWHIAFSSLTNYDTLLVILAVFFLLVYACCSLVQIVLYVTNKINFSALQTNNNSENPPTIQRIIVPKGIRLSMLGVKSFSAVGFILIGFYFFFKLFLTFSLSPTLSLILAGLSVVFSFIFIGECYPHYLANKHVKRYYPFVRSLMGFIGTLWPFSIGIKKMQDKQSLPDELKSKEDKNRWKTDELASAITLSDSLSLFPPSDQRKQTLFEGILKFGNTDAKHIMCPRIDVVGIEEKSSLQQVVETITQTGYSRLPIYRETIDHVIGIIYAKDLLPYLSETNTQLNWLTMMREPLFVPENKKNYELLKDFQSKKMHFAIVIDEYGGSSGIVTLEDVLEEIVGDISDEYDEDENFYTQIDPTTFLFDGRIDLEDFYSVLQINDPLFKTNELDVETLSGFIVQFHGKIPKLNEPVLLGNVKLLVEDADKKRIKKVKAIKITND